MLIDIKEQFLRIAKLELYKKAINTKNSRISNCNLKNATNKGFYGPAISKVSQDICYAPFLSGFWDTLYIIFWVFKVFLHKKILFAKVTTKYATILLCYVMDESMVNGYVNFESPNN